ncbi:porin [Caballeronia sp. 15715]|uniref:porin n=1 Tax=unclassified Caballeronia TaxID=2646786 RepID=UPI0039E4BDAF
MKKTVLALAATSLFSGLAHAQSSVTLYGIIDEGFDYTSNSAGHASYQLVNGMAQGSRWGLRGAEDLGGGLKAVFWLENGFNVNTGTLGQGGLGFGRQASVGLSSNRYGTFTVGRQYDSLFSTYLGPTTANGNWGGLLLAHPYDNDNTDGTFRNNNSVKYDSPNIGGFQIGGTYGFSNGTDFADNNSYSIGAKYTNGGLLVAAAYLRAESPGENSTGAIPPSGSADFVSKGLQIFGGGVNYTFGKATLGFVYTNSLINQPAATATSVYIGTIAGPGGGIINSLRFQNFEVNFRYLVTPSFFIGGQYVYTTEKMSATNLVASPKINLLGLMVDYSLSKRTDVYLQSAYERVSGDKTGTVLDHAYITTTAGGGLSSSANQLAVRIAVRHRF